MEEEEGESRREREEGYVFNCSSLRIQSRMRVQTFHNLQGVEVSLPTCINVEDLLGIPDQSVKVHRENNLKGREWGEGKRREG